MSVAVDVSRDGVTVPVAATRVREIVQTVCLRERVREAMISVTFVTSRAMARLNREYLSHRGSTDIITFELQKVAGVVIGDMYICPDVARERTLVCIGVAFVKKFFVSSYTERCTYWGTRTRMTRMRVSPVQCGVSRSG